MASWFTFEWVFVSWLITLFIHHRNIKRGAISDNVDELKELISDLNSFDWLDPDDHALFNEERYNSLLNRILWKTRQLNELAHCELLAEAELNMLYSFEIDELTALDHKCNDWCTLRFKLQEKCSNLIELIDKNYFDQVLSRKPFNFWLERHTIGGVICGFAIVYFFIEIMSFFFS
ncbi:hypothetical protein [Vibrio sp. SCSIO 43136]|uniref:hypothetical protein n=1 Tax=Vibrio sp. SCSIO 43136 TaxID=2819101 RepID=UPI002075457D|nr:hypothetical protein [Vibrio sp. SCSIO 43136]USD67158.1 hypothetical protein J4N39_21210 [Vibrio sp. SCSIO 43136]